MTSFKLWRNSINLNSLFQDDFFFLIIIFFFLLLFCWQMNFYFNFYFFLICHFFFSRLKLESSFNLWMTWMNCGVKFLCFFRADCGSKFIKITLFIKWRKSFSFFVFLILYIIIFSVSRLNFKTHTIFLFLILNLVEVGSLMKLCLAFTKS